MPKNAKVQDSETIYSVEKILSKREVNGRTEYLIKWEGYPSSENTWEPENHIYCKSVIMEYEESQKGKRERRESKQVKEKNSKQYSWLRGFDKGLKPERIMGASDEIGDLIYLMKWQDTNEASFVTAREANVRCPQIVIKFYEERLTWPSSK